MAKPTNSGEKVLVFAEITNLNFKYGYPAAKKLFNAYGSILGLTAYNGQQGVFFGADSPQPGKARKKEGAKTVSSKYSDKKAKQLKKQLWKLSPASSNRGIRTEGTSITFSVDTPFGWEYAWNSGKNDKTKILSLGAKIPTDPSKLVWGINNMKPPRASKRGSDGQVFSCFIPPTQQSVEAAQKLGYNVTALDGEWL